MLFFFNGQVITEVCGIKKASTLSIQHSVGMGMRSETSVGNMEKLGVQDLSGESFWYFPLPLYEELSPFGSCRWFPDVNNCQRNTYCSQICNGFMIQGYQFKLVLSLFTCLFLTTRLMSSSFNW